MVRHRRTMGIDPGVANFAVVVLHGGKVAYARMLQNTISSMAQSCTDQRTSYRSSIRMLLDYTKPDEVLVEQFAVRGFGTQLTEVIGVMIGNLQALCDERGIKESVVMASTWKGYLKKVCDINVLYEQAKSIGLEHHVVDALCIALFKHHEGLFKPSDAHHIRHGLKACKKWLVRNSSEHVIDTAKTKRKKRKK